MATGTAPRSVPPTGGPGVDAGHADAGHDVADERDRDAVHVVDLTPHDGRRGVVLVSALVPGDAQDLMDTFVEVPVPPAPQPHVRPPRIGDLVLLVVVVAVLVAWPVAVMLLPVPDALALALVVGGWAGVAALLRIPVVETERDPPEAR